MQQVNSAFCSLRVSIPAYIAVYFFSLLRIVIFAFVFHLHPHPFAPFRSIVGARYESQSDTESFQRKETCARVSRLRMEMKETRILVNFISFIEICGLSDVRYHYTLILLITTLFKYSIKLSTHIQSQTYVYVFNIM